MDTVDMIVQPVVPAATGTARNPFYEGCHDGESPQQAETRRLDAALAARMTHAEFAVQPVVPAGYWLAPDEETPEMLKGALAAWDSMPQHAILSKALSAIYRAMRAAHLAATGETPHG